MSGAPIKLVLIESPLAGRHGPLCRWACCKEDVLENKRYARAAMKDCLDRGEAPLASLLLYDHEEIYDDAIPEQRDVGIAAGLAWGARADLTAVYTDRGISRGMELGIAAAAACGRPVEHRTLEDWSNR